MRVSSETISFFGMQSTIDSDPLLPRLNSLRLVTKLRGDDTASILVLLALLSPKITAVTLTLPHHDDILFQPILSMTSDRCPWLQELVLNLDSLSLHSPSVVGGFIAAFRHTLRTLEVRTSFEGQYLPVVANLPQLRSLGLGGGSESLVTFHRVPFHVSKRLHSYVSTEGRSSVSSSLLATLA